MSFSKMAALLPLLLALTTAQRIGTTTPELHPNLTTQFCTTSSGCVSRQSLLVTDALSRPFHSSSDPSVPCNPLNTTLCPDAATCAATCELEGVDYAGIGVATSGSALTMRQYLPDGAGGYKSVSPRLYLLAEGGENYEMLKLAGQELTYDVDVSALGCGMNGALYLSEMDASGGRSDLNPAGATYGTGYCDAQCFNTTFISGLPNLNNSGACCNEMDIWEANSQATALTPHTCSSPGPFLCTGDDCGKGSTGVCDKSGCGINPFASGAETYYGPGLTVDTAKPFTVVTQFITSDGTPASPLTEIRRLYVQAGKVIPNAGVTQSVSVDAQYGVTARADDAGAGGAITQDFCAARNASSFLRLGGMAGMGEALGRGVVLVFSIWNSAGDFMNWLDSGANGPCSNISGDPALIVRENPNVSVTFSNVRWGDVGSTFNVTGGLVPGVVNAAKESHGAVVGMGMGLAAGGWVGMLGVMGWAVFW